MNQNPNLNAASLFASPSGLPGTITPAASTAIFAIPDAGAAIAAAMGYDAGKISADEGCVLSMLIDNSPSIANAGQIDAIIQGVNGMLDAMAATKQHKGILVLLMWLNGGILDSYSLIKGATRLDRSNYRVQGGTPLYDRSAELAGIVLKKAEQFKKAGIPCRTITGIITDGKDEYSTTHRNPQDIAPVFEALLSSERNIAFAMGIGRYPFAPIFEAMGIPPAWHLLPDADPHSIREKLMMASQSAVQFSQAGGSGGMSQVGQAGIQPLDPTLDPTLGGFGAI